MANSLNADLTGKVVILKAETMKPAYRSLGWRRFLVNSQSAGFGADPHTMGTKVFGMYMEDFEDTFIRGGDIERFATEAELHNWSEEIALCQRKETERRAQLWQQINNQE